MMMEFSKALIPLTMHSFGLSGVVNAIGDKLEASTESFERPIAGIKVRLGNTGAAGQVG